MRTDYDGLESGDQGCAGGMCKGSRLASCPPCLLVWGGVGAYFALSWLIPWLGLQP